MLRVGYIEDIIPTWYFTIINSLFGLIFIFSFFILIFGRIPKDFNDSVFLAFSYSLLLILSAFGSIFIWAAGSLNYLWAYVLLISTFIPYRLFWGRYFTIKQNGGGCFSVLYKNNNTFSEIIKSLGFMILNFLAGMASEMIGVMALLFYILSLIYYLCVARKEGLRLPIWYYIGVFGFGLGWIVLYLSPGHTNRAMLIQQTIGKNSFYSLKDLWDMSFNEKLTHLSKTYARFIGQSIPLFALGILLFLVERVKAGKEDSL